uniref:Bulb-type lectin domain-containing protein n=1 Tax=Amphilophus citrinellus TaxID=61819 RepID=A0A3Q0S7M2_AMPCI
MSRNFISTDQELYQGDYLVSENGNYKAVFQEDGNFVIYGWSPVWNTATCGKKPHRILLQGDTNLVMYTDDDTPVWATGNHDFHDNSRMRLTLTNQGHLIVQKNGKMVWSSANSRGTL